MQGRATSMPNVLSLLGAFLATSLVIGLLGAGLVMPAVGATGLAAKSGVSLFNSLPGEFTTSPLAQQSKILDADGNVIATPYDENRIIKPLSDIALIMRKAQVAIEDSRFYEHGGVDLRGITRAMVSNLDGGGTQGASTLTQQYVKITLQENALSEGDKQAAQAATARTYTRKLQELKYAITLEKTLTKDQILEGYLNIVYYGDQAYGVEAASQHYFGHSAKTLDLSEAALLAGTVQLPGSTDPVHHPDKAQARRNVVLDRMQQLGIVTPAQAAKAKAIPVPKMLHLTQPKNTCAASPQPYFCEYVLAWLKQQPALGKNIPERINKINRGGLTIQTTLKPELQQAALKKLTGRVPDDNSHRIGAAATVIEPGTGKVLAMVQNTRFGAGNQKGTTQVNWNVDTRYGGTSGAAFGSTAKMYALVTALESGIPVNAKIYAKGAGPTPSEAALYLPSEMHDACKSGPWSVMDDEPTAAGMYPLSTAIAKSINTAFASLVLQLGACKVRTTMEQMGLHQGDGAPINPYPSAITLGSDAATPMTLAASYATLAAQGKYCVPIPVLSITTQDKKQLPIPKADCKQVIQPDIANGTTALLKHVITEGTGTLAKLGGGRVAAGKTGTTDGHSESWFVGYTPQRATAVWVGTPYSQDPMKNLCLGGQCYDKVWGATISAPLWKDIMELASQGLPKQSFQDPSSTVLQGDMVNIPSVSGMTVDQATTALQAAGFTAQVGSTTNSSLSPGLVVDTSPSGTALKGSSVQLITSTGYVPQRYTPPQPTPQATPQPTPQATPQPIVTPTPSASPSARKTPSPKKTPPPKRLTPPTKKKP